MHRPEEQDSLSQTHFFDREGNVEYVEKHHDPSKDILDGTEGKDLYDGMRHYTDSLGNTIVAGTDVGIFKDQNQDRVVVKKANNFTSVIDGVGGEEHGDVAAQALAEQFANNPDDIAESTANAINFLKQDTKYKNSAACFITARIVEEQHAAPAKAELQKTYKPKQFLEVWQQGDCSVIVLDENGAVIFVSKDDTMAQELVDSGAIPADKAYYHKYRDVVTSAVSPQGNTKPKTYPLIPLKAGYRVILMSDGINDNFDPEEIAQQIKGLRQEQAMKQLTDLTSQRMLNHEKIIAESHRQTEPVYSDGFKGAPKPDNRALAIIDIAA